MKNPPTNPESPYFSVLVPCYNHADFVGGALDSLLAQTEEDWEALVVNDGSTDNSREVLDAYGRRDARIRPVHKENGGAASALNEGLRRARGEWVCWLSSDDLFEPTKLHTHRAWIQKRPDSKFFFTHFRELVHETGEIGDMEHWRRIPEERWQILEMLESNYISGITICVNRQTLLDVGGFNEDMRYSQDYDMWLRLLPRTPAVYIDERTCIYRRHAGQGSCVNPDACFFDAAVVAIRFLNSHPLPTLFPSMDLSDPTQAMMALDHAIDAAANPHAFLYKLGAHAALIVRIMEWVWSISDGTLCRCAQRFFSKRADMYSVRFANTDLGTLWGLAESASRSRTTAFAYRPVQPLDTAEAACAPVQMSSPAKRASLRAYFEKMGKQHFTPPSPVPQSSMLRILFVAPPNVDVTTDVPYGALTATLRVARHLRDMGMVVTIAGLAGSPIGHVGGIPFVAAKSDVDLKRLLTHLPAYDVAVAVARSDVLSLIRAKRAVVYHHSIHTIPGGVAPDCLNKLHVGLICVSEYSRKVLVSWGIRPDLTAVVRNGCDERLFSVMCGVPRDERGIVLAGNICHYKGTDIALRAFELLRQSYPNARLTICGNEPVPWSSEHPHLLDTKWLNSSGFLDWGRLALDIPGCAWVGEKAPLDMPKVFRENSILIMPSRLENFPLVSLEAQACGCIPVLPRTGGMPETVCEGKTGVIYETNTPEALAAAITELWQAGLPDSDWRDSAVARIHESLTWRQSAATFADVLLSKESPRFKLGRRRVWSLCRRIRNKAARLRGTA